MNFTFDERIDSKYHEEYKATAIQVYENEKRMKKERNKLLYNLENAVGFFDKNPTSPFIVLKWDIKDSEEMKIVVFD